MKTRRPAIVVTAFDERVADARRMMRGGASKTEVREKHGKFVLEAALDGLAKWLLMQRRPAA